MSCLCSTQIAAFPLSTIASSDENYFMVPVAAGRTLNVLHIPSKGRKTENDSNTKSTEQSETKVESAVETVLITPDNRVGQEAEVDSGSPEGLSNAGFVEDMTGASTVVVTADIERPKTNESKQSKCSLPPLSPSFSPLSSFSLKTTSSGSSPIQTRKKTKWGLLYRKRERVSDSSNSKKKQEGKASNTPSVGSQMDRIESLPNPPPESVTDTTLFRRRSSSFRPNSSWSTFRETPLPMSPISTTDRVVFFIHGVGGCLHVWKHQTRYFSELGYEIIALDLIGHGKSSSPKQSQHYQFNSIRQDILTIFDRFAKRSNIIVGHSYGTCFAVVLARERSQKVSHLVLISSGAPVPLAPEPVAAPLVDNCLCCLQPLLKRSFLKSAFSKQPTMGELKEAYGISPNILKRILDGQDWPEGDVAYHSMIDSHTLLIYGCEDRFVSLDEMLEMKHAIHNSRLEVIESSSHMVMLEVPAQINHLIEEFVRLPHWLTFEENEEREVIRRAGKILNRRPSTAHSRVLPHVKLLPL